MVTIFTEKKSTRIDFIFNQLFKEILGCKFTITDNEKKYLDSSYPAICYAKNYNGKGIHIVPHGLLFEEGVRHIEPEISYWEDLPVFFQTQGKEIPFDIFSASFYIISRYEEYLEKERDKHGRYPAEKSLAFRYGFLDQPIVDQWAMQLLKILQNKFPELVFKAPHFRFIPTIDVDNVFAFRHKGPFINGYYLLKELLFGKFEKAKYRLAVILRLREDPFFNLQKIASLHQACGTFPLFFFHCGCYGRRDKKTFLPSFKYMNAKKEISRDFIVGLHPSYHATFSAMRLKIEHKIMEECTFDGTVFHSRFHYLRFHIPESFRMLLREKIYHDWSMGYSTHTGFRAGTSFPFNFYNLNKDKIYRLIIHPFAVMDKTLKIDMNLNEEEAKQYVLNLAQRVKAVNGVFVTIFHNENLTDAFSWRGWRKMYYSLLKELGVSEQKPNGNNASTPFR